MTLIMVVSSCVAVFIVALMAAQVNYSARRWAWFWVAVVIVVISAAGAGDGVYQWLGTPVQDVDLVSPPLKPM
jgi:predicted RND superfamily exporter protein